MMTSFELSKFEEDMHIALKYSESLLTVQFQSKMTFYLFFYDESFFPIFLVKLFL